MNRIVLCINKLDGWNVADTSDDTPLFDHTYFVTSKQQLRQLLGQEPMHIVLSSKFKESGLYDAEVRDLISQITGVKDIDKITFVTITDNDKRIILPVVGWNVSIDSNVPAEGQEWPVPRRCKVSGWYNHMTTGMVLFISDTMSYDRALFILGDVYMQKIEDME